MNNTYINPPEDNEEIVITKQKKIKEHLPPYNLVGNGLTNKHGTSLDIIDVCARLSHSEIKLLQFFRNEFNYGCIRKEKNPNLITPTKCDDWDDYLKVVLKKMYLHLEHVGLLIRVKRGTYLLNPYLFMFSTGYKQIQEQWDTLAKEKELGNDEVQV